MTQGKGVTLAAAKASGMMEALELFHAERISVPLRLASYDELRLTGSVVDVAGLHRPANNSFDQHIRILWVEAADLLSGGSAWLPFELLHLDCTRPSLPGAGAFQGSSNGLASGNDYWEAVIHAVCEVIERDSLARFEALAPEEQDRRLVRLATVDDPACCWALERYERAGTRIAVWDITGPTGIAAFLSGLLVDSEGADGGSRLYHGMGCHPDRGVALSRALTEAAQSRLTMITGSRDDAGRVLYARGADADRTARARALFVRAAPLRAFADISTRTSDDLAEDGHWILERVAAAGFAQVLAVDLTIEELGIPVVHVVIPGARSMGGFEPPPGGLG